MSVLYPLGRKLWTFTGDRCPSSSGRLIIHVSGEYIPERENALKAGYVLLKVDKVDKAFKSERIIT